MQAHLLEEGHKTWTHVVKRVVPVGRKLLVPMSGGKMCRAAVLVEMVPQVAGFGVIERTWFEAFEDVYVAGVDPVPEVSV